MWGGLFIVIILLSLPCPFIYVLRGRVYFIIIVFALALVLFFLYFDLSYYVNMDKSVNAGYVLYRFRPLGEQGVVTVYSSLNVELFVLEALWQWLVLH